MTTVVWGRLDAGIVDGIFDAEPVELDFGDRYQVGERLGAGGQGTVYRAWDRHLGRPVAIKHLHPCPGMDPLTEARLIGQLAHPAIPQVYDQGICPDGSRFVVVQYIDGRPLHQYLATANPSLPARIVMFRQIAGAVAHAHGRGILHRDVKPGNVLVTAGGEPYLVDWGLAASGGSRAVCGSPMFAAPEQLSGQVVDRRADVYAMGVLFYFILAGTYPFERQVTDFNEFRRIRGGLVQVPLRRRRSDLPRYLGRICEIAMSTQPGARYADLPAMLTELDRAAQTGQVAHDLHRWPPALRWAAVFLSVALAAAAGWLAGRREVSDDSPYRPVAGSPGGAILPPVASGPADQLSRFLGGEAAAAEEVWAFLATYVGHLARCRDLPLPPRSSPGPPPPSAMPPPPLVDEDPAPPPVRSPGLPDAGEP
jgi:serine/threonine-protein kinase